MKLYTADQVKILLNALIDIKNWNEELEDEWEDCGYRAMDAIDAFADKEEIELPSDEEIKENADKYTIDDNTYYSFINGAKWMKEQILNQNK